MRPHLEFHIKENDSFGTLATLLDLIRRDLHRRSLNRHGLMLSESAG
jgi:hypothetical protein